MSRLTDLTSAIYAARHCDDFNCAKCRARIRWTRRKAWRTRKSTNLRNRDRKR